MILSILQHTPVWVFAVFAGLLLLGIQRLRTQETPVARLVILPVAMTIFSLFGLTQAFGTGSVPSAAWAAAFVFALLVGRLLPPRAGVQYSAATRTVRVPGSWLPLVLMMTIFFLRYAVAVAIAMNAPLRQDATFVAAVAALYGLTAGCFAARTLRTWRSRDRSSSAAFAVPA